MADSNIDSSSLSQSEKTGLIPVSVTMDRKDYRKLSQEEKIKVDEIVKRKFDGTKVGDDFMVSNIKDGFRCYECFCITCMCHRLINTLSYNG